MRTHKRKKALSWSMVGSISYCLFYLDNYLSLPVPSSLPTQKCQEMRRRLVRSHPTTKQKTLAACKNRKIHHAG
ncbi:hypothetical protein [Nostoc sp.]|uniref:hypothetical protein n=1 Tax=Nostoc sp. TaxID=1180 RepID=UPI002FF838D3